MRPIDIAPANLETIRRILCEHTPGLEVRVFGSRVSWTARATSDLDLALMTTESLNIGRMAELKAAFTESDLPFRVDIVDWASTSESFRRVIQADHVVLQSARAANDASRRSSIVAGAALRDPCDASVDCHHSMPPLPPTWKRRDVVGNLPSGTTQPRGLPPVASICWPIVPARDILKLRYGKALVEQDRRPGAVAVYGTNGRCGTHDTPLFEGPGVILGRKGQGPLGVEWSAEPYWVIDTAYSLTPLRRDVHLKFAYYVVKFVGLNHLKDGNVESDVKSRHIRSTGPASSSAA